jgi:ATP-dependent RNA helicase RhlE
MQAFEVATERKQELLQRLLNKESGRVLVFARTKRGTERICKSLNRDGFSASMIHGDRSQSQRMAALAAFQQGRIKVLVATDLASRGIHVQDIAHVINYDLPEVAENFIHRVGRTGRNGGKGVASTLFSREQRSEIFHMERQLGIKMERLLATDGTAAPHNMSNPTSHAATSPNGGARPPFVRPDVHRSEPRIQNRGTQAREDSRGNSYAGSHSGSHAIAKDGYGNGSRGGFNRNSNRGGRNDSRRSSSFAAGARDSFSTGADPNARPTIIRLPGEVLQAQVEN